MKTLPLLICAGLLAACSGKAPTPQSAPPAAKAARVATPWDALKADEQRARDVQQVVNKQADEQRKAIDAQSQ